MPLDIERVIYPAEHEREAKKNLMRLAMNKARVFGIPRNRAERRRLNEALREVALDLEEARHVAGRFPRTVHHPEKSGG